jgi:hypothetical protein
MGGGGRQKRNAYRILVGKPQERRPLRRHRNSEDYNTKLHFNVNGLGVGVNLIYLALDRGTLRAVVSKANELSKFHRLLRISSLAE